LRKQKEIQACRSPPSRDPGAPSPRRLAHRYAAKPQSMLTRAALHAQPRKRCGSAGGRESQGAHVAIKAELSKVMSANRRSSTKS